MSISLITNDIICSLFKETPDPDEKQIIAWSKQLGLHPRQVKFWLENHRSEIKVFIFFFFSRLMQREFTF